jgi:hypothetical protein
MLSDHYRGGATERLLVSIITVDPSNGRIEAVGKDAAVIQVVVGPQTPALFRWPAQGELWTIVRENGVWGLENWVPGPDNTPLASLNPGEGIVQTDKIWTPSGDYLLTSAVDYALQADLTTLHGQVSTDESNFATHVTNTAPYVEAVTFAGPFPTTTPGATTGSLFTLPRAGRVLIDCGCTAYVNAAVNIIIEVWVDGINTSRTMTLAQTIPISSRLTPGPCKIAMTLTSGAHYIAFKQTGGVSDTADYGNIAVIMP